MGPISIFFGVLLTLLGVGLYFGADYFEVPKSPTALIPCAFGIALIVLGILARKEKLRMHVMHLAALLGLIGFAIPAYRVISALVRGSAFTFPINGQIAMAVLCAIFLALCINSFIQIRIARKQRAAQIPPPTH